MSGDALAAPSMYVTPPSWARAQRDHLDELLLEQAHLEKKAAAGAVALLFRVAVEPRLQRRLSALAREELVHFERTLKLLHERGDAFEPQESSGYAEQLKKAVRTQRSDRLVDELLVAAVIERRSHERMTMLADATRADEPAVSRFYADLCPAEERHEELYLELAALSREPAAVRARYEELLGHEADVLRRLPFSPRLHSGAPNAD